MHPAAKQKCKRKSGRIIWWITSDWLYVFPSLNDIWGIKQNDKKKLWKSMYEKKWFQDKVIPWTFFLKAIWNIYRGNENVNVYFLFMHIIKYPQGKTIFKDAFKIPSILHFYRLFRRKSIRLFSFHGIILNWQKIVNIYYCMLKEYKCCYELNEIPFTLVLIEECTSILY